MVKVISTYGPSLYDRSVLEAVVRESDIIRLNISHESADQAVKTFNLLSKYNLPIMIDTCGPEVRLRVNGKFLLRKGGILEVGAKSSQGCTFDQVLYGNLKVGQSIYLNDGMRELRLESASKGMMQFKAMDDVTISDRMAVNLRGRSFKFPILKPTDIDVLKRINPTFIALSYTRNVNDIRAARKYTNAKIIAKIENAEGVKNISQVIDEADGVMIARGDLGIEVPGEEVPLIQKEIVGIANNHAKPSIVATQVLYSMIDNPAPTRAEVSDIANAVLDGTDAIMLSNETAVGKYPLSAVRMIKKVGNKVASHVKANVVGETCPASIEPVSDALSKTIYSLALSKEIDKIVVVTRSGYSARLLSRFKLPKPIIALTTEQDVALELNLLYNTTPLFWNTRPERHLVSRAALLCLEKGLVDESDTVIFTAAVRTRKTGITNMIEIHSINDMVSFLEPSK